MARIESQRIQNKYDEIGTDRSRWLKKGFLLNQMPARWKDFIATCECSTSKCRRLSAIRQHLHWYIHGKSHADHGPTHEFTFITSLPPWKELPEDELTRQTEEEQLQLHFQRQLQSFWLWHLHLDLQVLQIPTDTRSRIITRTGTDISTHHHSITILVVLYYSCLLDCWYVNRLLNAMSIQLSQVHTNLWSSSQSEPYLHPLPQMKNDDWFLFQLPQRFFKCTFFFGSTEKWSQILSSFSACPSPIIRAVVVHYLHPFSISGLKNRFLFVILEH